jgi:hypothetical protein
VYNSPALLNFFTEGNGEAFAVGLYKLHPVDQQLEAAWFQPSSLEFS